MPAFNEGMTQEAFRDSDYEDFNQTKTTLANPSVSPNGISELKKKEIDAYSNATTGSSNSSSLVEANTNIVSRTQDFVIAKVNKYSTFLKYAIIAACLIGYTIYFGFAISYSIDMAEMLIILTCLAVALIIYTFIRDTFGDALYKHCWEPFENFWNRHWDIIKWILFPGLIIAVILYLCLGVIQEARQLISISGMVVFITYTFITSKHPDRIKWRPVIWGYSLQFVMAILVLRWEAGYKFFEFLGDEITVFINYAFEGAAALFGDPFMVFHPFAMLGMSMIIYMGAVMSVCYYVGLTQLLAGKMAWLMQKTMGTTAIETLGVAANIFLNGMDVMLMLRSYLDKLTESEFHCFLVGGHSTIAGFMFGLFVLFGAPPQHLISAAVMSAPAVIAITKLNHPETEESITKNVEDVRLESSGETNIFEAGANGASVAGKTVAAVMVSYIAFLGMLAWFNATLAWLGARVGYPNLSFEEICGYVFWPIPLVIGVDVPDCQAVAKLIGIKIMTTEIYAYQTLGNMAKDGLISPRSEVIATYAMCGFSSLSTLAIAVGVWQAICPQKSQSMASQMLRAIVNANVSCFMTACIAGLMYRDDFSEVPDEGGAAYPIIGGILGIIPGYKDLMALVGL